MHWSDWLPAILVAIIAALPGLVALYQTRKKPAAEAKVIAAETEKKRAETDLIHAQVADRWAEHVGDLQVTVNVLEAQAKKDRDGFQRDMYQLEKQGECDRHEITGLRLDIQQVRRDNEQYRLDLIERDAIIADMQDWTERLLIQFKKHIPDVEPEKFIRRRNPIHEA